MVRNTKRMRPFRKARRPFGLDSRKWARVGLSFDYALQYGRRGAVMDRLLVRPRFTGLIPRVLDGLERHLEDKVDRWAITIPSMFVL